MTTNVFTGITAVAYASLRDRKTVLVDGIEADIMDARELLYTAPERITLVADYKAVKWTGALKQYANTGSLPMARRTTADSRRLASAEEMAERLRIATHERALFDAEAEEIKRGGWAPSKYKEDEWYAIDARGFAIKPTKIKQGTHRTILAFVREQATHA